MDATGALLREGIERLRLAGSETARLDAQLLLGDAAGLGRTAVVAHPESLVGLEAAARYRAGIERRAAGEPVAYIRGVKEFYGLAFTVDRRALIPRPETERLVELADAEVHRRLDARARAVDVAPIRIVDVGTGSGAVAVALAVSLRRRGVSAAVEIVAFDVSEEALRLARANAVRHAAANAIVFGQTDLLTAGDQAGAPADGRPFDLVLANLPYVRRDSLPGLPVAASFEPSLALDGGVDGLAVIERLLTQLPDRLAEGGIALLEIGADQGEAIVERCASVLPGWRCTVEPDLAGLPRIARIEPDQVVAVGDPSSAFVGPSRTPGGRVRHHRPVSEPLSPQPILPIELIALDIDGTLIGDDLIIGPDTRAAVQAALSRGVFVSIVTGRMVSSAMRFARELGLSAPVVGYQGGLIRSMPGHGSDRLGRLLFHSPIPASVAREIVEWTLELGLDPHINHLERFILRADDPNADDYSAFMGARAELVTDLAASIRHPVTKVLAVGTPPLPTDLAPLARARFEGVAGVTISHPKFLEFVAPGVSKGRAVRWLARRLRVRLGATLAIGDQWNDIEMLAEVGHGAAMPSAPAAVQAAARYIAPPLHDEGVARMIEALVLAPPAAARAASRRMTEEAEAARAGFVAAPAPGPAQRIPA